MIDTATKAPCTKDGCQLSADMGKGPYASSVNLYTEFGWRGVLPLPHMKKMTPPSGFTGMVNNGVYPTDHQIHVWAHNSNHNVALRLPENVLGIDVDHYEKKGVEKDGADQLAELEGNLGPLPATWRSTSRGYDNPSGIRFYRVPSGLLWPSKTGFIDFVQHNYRYAVVWPSEVVNESTGEVRQYQWYAPDGHPTEHPPQVEALAELPQAWVDHLQNLPKVKENDDLEILPEDMPGSVIIPDEVDPSTPWYVKALAAPAAVGRGNDNSTAVAGGVAQMFVKAGLPYEAALAFVLNYERASRRPQSDEIVTSQLQRFWAKEVAKKREREGNPIFNKPENEGIPKNAEQFTKRTGFLGIQDDEFTVRFMQEDKSGKKTVAYAPVANFSLVPTRVIMGMDRRAWRVNVFKGSGELIGERMISSEELIGEREFKKWMRAFGGATYPPNQANGQFMTADQVTMFLDSFDLPELSEIGFTGWNQIFNAFVTNEGVIKPGRAALAPFTDCLPSEYATENSKSAYGFDVSCEEAVKIFKEWLTWHDEKVAAVLGSWLVMVVLRGQFPEGEMFPALQIEGLAESGKTSYTKSGLQMIGVDTSGGAWTRASAENAYTANNNGVVWFDDVHINEDLQQLIRLAITKGAKNKMSVANASKRAGGKFRAATIISSEGMTTNFNSQKANRDRLIKLDFPIIATRESIKQPGKNQYEVDVKPLKARFNNDFTRIAGSLVASILSHSKAIGDVDGSSRVSQSYGYLKAGARVLESLTGDSKWVGLVDEWISSQEDLGNASSVILEVIPTVWRHLGFPTRPGEHGLVMAVYRNERDGEFRVNVPKLADIWSQVGRQDYRTRSLTDATGIDTELRAVGAEQRAPVKAKSIEVDDGQGNLITRDLSVKYRAVPGRYTDLILSKATGS